MKMRKVKTPEHPFTGPAEGRLAADAGANMPGS